MTLLLWDLMKKNLIKLPHNPDGKYLVPENVKELNIPLHPGALKYYQEIGQEIPERLIY